MELRKCVREDVFKLLDTKLRLENERERGAERANKLSPCKTSVPF
jgi:hypothetical protein